MADEKQVSANSLLNFVRWDDTDPIAVIDQIRDRLIRHVQDGDKVGFAAVLVWVDKEDGQPIYSPCHSTLPQEVVSFCGQVLQRQATRVLP